MTNEALRQTWNNEQWVIDRLVEAVEAGNGSAKQKLGQQLIRGYTEHDWHRGRVLETGLFLDPTDLDPARARPEEVTDLFDGDEDVSEERLKELANGAAMNELEAARWRARGLERAFGTEFALELEMGAYWAVIEVKHSKRGTCCVGILDWAGDRERFVAAFSTRIEILNALKSEGYLSEKDYAVRGPHCVLRAGDGQGLLNP